jgi:hypothetical protein
MKGVNAREPVQIRLLGQGWSLVGNGPSYLLFGVSTKEVMHLAGGLHRELRDALKGYEAIRDGKLVPLVRAMTLFSPMAELLILDEIRQLIFRCSREEIFEGRLRRFATLIRAARRFQMYQGPPGLPEGNAPRGSFFAHTQFGQHMLYSNSQNEPFRCKANSKIAQCAQALWRREQSHWDGQATVLYRTPTRKELREYLDSDEATVTKLCRAEGFDWLPGLRDRARDAGGSRKREDRVQRFQGNGSLSSHSTLSFSASPLEAPATIFTDVRWPGQAKGFE